MALQLRLIILSNSELTTMHKHLLENKQSLGENCIIKCWGGSLAAYQQRICVFLYIFLPNFYNCKKKTLFTANCGVWCLHEAVNTRLLKNLFQLRKLH